MLLATVNPEAAQAVGNIKKVGVGNVVTYHGRQGYVRQGRAEFPALVMKQHQDDGSLDLLVFMEAEDVILEQRIAFRSHNQAHHCWSVVEDVPGAVETPPLEANDVLLGMIELLQERIEVLENRPKPGRPRKPVVAEQA